MEVSSSSSRLAARWLIALRWWLLGVAGLVAVFAYSLSRQLDFDRSIESMFAEHDPVLEPYRDLQRLFVGNENVLAVYDDPEFLQPSGAGIERLGAVAQQLAQVDGVRDVLSLAEVNQAIKRVYALGEMLTGDGNRFPIVDPENRLAQRYLTLFEGYTHSDDGRTVSIVCLLEPEESSRVSRRKTIVELRKIIALQPQGQLTGEPVLVSDGFDYVERDGERLGRTSMFLLAVVIIACFRSIRWVLIPLAIVFWSLWVSRSVIVMLGLQLSMVGSMLAAIVAVIAVATVIHIIVRYREARSEGRSQRESLEQALSRLIVPISWACITDAAGFAALLVAATGPVRDFGLMMAIASLSVLLGILLLVPGLGLLGSLALDPTHVWGEERLKSALRASTRIIKRRAKPILVTIIAAFVLVGSGVLFLRVETDFINNFRSDTEIAKAYEFVETRMGGAGLLDVILPAPRTLTQEYLQRVEKLQEDLRQLQLSDLDPALPDRPALNKIVSLADLDRAVSDLPVVSLLSPEIRFQVMAQVLPTFAAALRHRSDRPNLPVDSADGDRGHSGPGNGTARNAGDRSDYLRVMLRTSQRGTAAQQQALIREVQAIVERHFPPAESGPAAQTTGIYVLLAHLVSSLLADQVRTFATAILFIFLTMWVALRSWRLALVAMVPNLIPIVMLMGMLGWLGIKLNMGAVMIAAVSIGLSIDSSIHYLYVFKRWRRLGESTFEAIQHAQHRVGRAAMFSTLALVAGFSTLCFSPFIPTVYFGALVSLSMLGGLLGNLILLPSLLLVLRTDVPSRSTEDPHVNRQAPPRVEIENNA